MIRRQVIILLELVLWQRNHGGSGGTVKMVVTERRVWDASHIEISLCKITPDVHKGVIWEVCFVTHIHYMKTNIYFLRSECTHSAYDETLISREEKMNLSPCRSNKPTCL